MANDYIELHRQFAVFDAKNTGEHEYRGFGLASSIGSTTWDQILKFPCSVIIAEAGNGKTMEMRHQAQSLRAKGIHAFFCRLDLLAASPFSNAIEIGTKGDFAAWQTGQSDGVFFLDSVDEAKLLHSSDFEKAILNFVHAIEDSKSRVTAVVSTRPHAWQAYADRDMLSGRLGLPPRTQIEAHTASDKESDAADFETDESSSSAKPNEVGNRSHPITIFQMMPLDERQVRLFATARGVTDQDAFIEAIERADAEAFANRPADLPGLIHLWKTRQTIGLYSDVVNDNISLKLGEANTSHDHHGIALDRALTGAVILAAACTLTRRTSILLPDQVIDPSLAQNALDPRQVLKGWTPTEIQALLSRALFDESLYGTVRFHHRTSREYLTAAWFGKLIQNHKGRRSIDQIFFGSPYGTQKIAVVPSLKPIAAWLALRDQQFRDKCLGVDPTILLEYGDASALDVDTRARLLTDFAARYRSQMHTPMNLDLREARRLSDTRLADTIKKLLKDYSKHIEVRQLLLKLVREGGISACSPVALKFALNTSIDTYSRTCAIQAVGACGTQSEKEKLAKYVVDNSGALDHSVLSAAVEFLWPAKVSDHDLLDILTKTSAVKEYSVDVLEYKLKAAIEKISHTSRLETLLRGVVSLLSAPPLQDDRHCRISTRYSWLVPICWVLARRLYKGSTQVEHDTVLSAVSICEQADHLQHYVGDTHKEVIALINSDALLKRALFWNNVRAARLNSKQPVISWFQATYSFSIAFFAEEDAEPFFNSIREETLLEDKQVALSVLLWLHRNGKMSDGFLERVTQSVQGTEVLEQELANYISPPPPSEEMAKSAKLHRDLERKRKRHQTKDKIARDRGIAEVRANPHAIGDLEIAKDGKIWNRTWWLYNETMGDGSSGNRWSNGNWAKLVPTFGSQVAHGYRDFCKQFWRRYVPTQRSDGGPESNHIPNALILGLSGLQMEAQERTDWAKHLTIEEAKLAAKYALHELNALPSWFDQLLEQFPEKIKDILLREIEWEFDAPQRAESFHYVLSRLRWTSPHLGKMLRSDLLTLIEKYPSASVNTLSEALTVVLRDPGDLPNSLIRTIKANVTKSNGDSRKAFWISILLCLDAPTAILLFEAWVNGSQSKLEAEERVSAVLNGIVGDRHDGKSEHHRSFLQATILTRLIKLANDHIRAEDDLEHEGVYSLGQRDHAQGARQQLTELLWQIPGQATHTALVELSHYHTSQFPKDRMLVLAEQRAEADLEHSKKQWQAIDVTNFSEEAERVPKSQADLFDLCMSRLDDLKLDIEEGDESEASLFRKIADELELRRVIANRLKHAAAGKYTTGSEEELADETRNDIRIHNPAVEARLPVEIKIAGRWSGVKFLERLKNQLIKQYMRDAKFGIFLLVNREGKSERKRWKVNGKLFDFQHLLGWLSEEAKKLLRSTPRIEGLAVVGFDLVVRDKSALANVVERKAERKKTAVSRKGRLVGKKVQRQQNVKRKPSKSAVKKIPGRKSRKSK